MLFSLSANPVHHMQKYQIPEERRKLCATPSTELLHKYDTFQTISKTVESHSFISARSRLAFLEKLCRRTTHRFSHQATLSSEVSIRSTLPFSLNFDTFIPLSSITGLVRGQIIQLQHGLGLGSGSQIREPKNLTRRTWDLSMQ